VVRSTVEETLNAMLDAEADRLCQVGRYERTEARQDTRAGSYQRQLHTKVGQVSLRVPRLRTLPFETAIIECLLAVRKLSGRRVNRICLVFFCLVFFLTITI
jgi:transposase-like protein